MSTILLRRQSDPEILSVSVEITQSPGRRPEVVMRIVDSVTAIYFSDTPIKQRRERTYHIPNFANGQFLSNLFVQTVGQFTGPITVQIQQTPRFV